MIDSRLSLLRFLDTLPRLLDEFDEGLTRDLGIGLGTVAAHREAHGGQILLSRHRARLRDADQTRLAGAEHEERTCLGERPRLKSNNGEIRLSPHVDIMAGRRGGVAARRVVAARRTRRRCGLLFRILLCLKIR